MYQRCERDVLATCNCGVMVRSGDDVLVIDRCVRRRHRMPPPLAGFSDDHGPIMSVVLYLNGKLTPGTRIHQLADGRKYIVSPFTTGTFPPTLFLGGGQRTNFKGAAAPDPKATCLIHSHQNFRFLSDHVKHCILLFVKL